MKYYPIILSKKGELIALHQLAQDVKENICPVIEIIEDTIIKEIKEKKVPTGEYKYDTFFEDILKEHWVFPDNQIILDVSLFNDVVSNISVIRKLFNTLIKAKVNVVPAVQKNSEKVYLELVKELVAKYDCNICIRTSNNSGGFLDYNNRVNDLLGKLNRTPKEAVLLLDLGQVDKDDYTIKGDVAGTAIEKLTTPIKKWGNVVVSASSFPKDLSDFAPRDEPYRLKRYEWNLFQDLKSIDAFSDIKYGDYGTKSAIFTDAKFPGTISLKYTSKKEFIICRGKKTDDHSDGHGQYITHAKKLVKSTDYSGADFSWGDSKIDEISRQTMGSDRRKTGNAQTWVEYSQNHHMTLLDSIL